MLFADPSVAPSGLSPADQVIAELKALLAGTAKGEFVQIVRALNLPRSDGKVWSAQRIAESIDRLV